MARLRETGEEPDRKLLKAVKAQGPAVAPTLIAMATDRSLHEADQESPEVWAPLHAIRLLGELGAVEAIDPLLQLLTGDQDESDEWLNEALQEYFGRVGRPALLPLRAVLCDRTLDVSPRLVAVDALEEIARRHPDLRDDVVAALAARLDPAESQTPQDETLDAFVIAALLDLKAVEARSAMVQAFDEDRVDRRIVDLDSVAEEMGLPAGRRAPLQRRGAGLRLWLRCTACRYERPHEVEKVYYDAGFAERRRQGQEPRYSEFVIPQRIACPKCGAVDQYEMTGDAHLALTAELLKSMARSTPPEAGDSSPLGALARLWREFEGPADDEESRIVPMRFTVAGGREMHPYAAREMYEQKVAQEPRRADLRVYYANVLRFLDHNDDAAQQYRAAVELDATNVEAYANLGMLAREAGDRTEAQRMFERVVELIPGSRMSRQEREDYQAFAHEELTALIRPGDSPPLYRERMLGPHVEQGGRPREAVAAPVQPRAPSKVGRNDPCPCGSGLKYKKCCGR